MKNRRRELRNNATFEEKLLWKYLQNKKLGFKFIRQYSIEGYVVDFYCPAKRLVIELDGNFHKNNLNYDKYRNKYLGAFNIKVIRFWNQEIMNDVEDVVEKIKKIVSPPPFGFPPLNLRGGIRK